MPLISVSTYKYFATIKYYSIYETKNGISSIKFCLQTNFNRIQKFEIYVRKYWSFSLLHNLEKYIRTHLFQKMFWTNRFFKKNTWVSSRSLSRPFFACRKKSLLFKALEKRTFLVCWLAYLWIPWSLFPVLHVHRKKTCLLKYNTMA